MDRFLDSLIALQGMFLNEAACGELLASSVARRFRMGGLPPSNLGDGETTLRGSKPDNTFWFWATCLMATHSNGISALKLHKQRGIGYYHTAWTLASKLHRVMVDSNRNLLSGLIEVDESLLALRATEIA